MAEFLLALFLFALIYGGLLWEGYQQKESYKDLYITIIGGKGEGQVRLISEYDKASKKGTVVWAWNIEPDQTSEFIITTKNGQVIYGG